MATAEQTLPLNLEAFNRLSQRQKIGLIAAVALAIALLVGGLLWAKEPAYGVVFANLSEKDGGEVVAALDQLNIPHKISDNGSAILVPAGQVHDVRLRLASQGLPKGGLVGFEVMETQKLGISQFVEQINFQRALEGELARSIQSLAAVGNARVHLAIPKQTAFLRDEQKPTASVLLTLLPGRSLDPSQVAGIIHLVSSSVPQLAPGQVSVIDQDGNLISKSPNDPGNTVGLNPAQLRYLRDLEQEYRKRVEAILAPVVGSANVRAQVTADVDFSLSEKVAETYKPNPTPDTTIRSQQTAESANGPLAAQGVPGALTNQPPVPATAPITSPPVPAGGTTASNTPTSYSRNATINYEVDKTVRHTKEAPGTIRRLAVAAVVNYKMDAAKGKPLPLSDAEMRQINALVQQAVGFDKERGDTVSVANVSFAPDEGELVAGLPLWQDPQMIALALDAGKWLLFALVALVLWKKLFKPLFEMFAATAHRVEAEEEQAAEAVTGHGDTGPQVRGYEQKLQDARDLARDDPKLVAGLIREWVGGESR